MRRPTPIAHPLMSYEDELRALEAAHRPIVKEPLSIDWKQMAYLRHVVLGLESEKAMERVGISRGKAHRARYSIVGKRYMLEFRRLVEAEAAKAHLVSILVAKVLAK